MEHCEVVRTEHRASENPFVVQPLTENCARVARARTHAVFGISQFNSYFSRERIAQIVQWGAKNFRSMHFHIPDVPCIYTLEAMGYPPAKAKKRAREESNRVRNRTLRNLSELGIDHPERLILDWAALTDNDYYRERAAEVNHCFEHDTPFRRACLDTSRIVLRHRLPEGAPITDEQVLSASRYLLSQIPLLLDTAGIVGRTSSVYCYHQSFLFGDLLYAGELALKPAERQGYLMVR